MSAVNAKVPEPSMDEILASIRRIIADDGEGDAVPAPAEASPTDGSAKADNPGEPSREPPTTSSVELPEIDFADPLRADPPPVQPEGARDPGPEPRLAPEPADTLVSSEATRAVSISFEALSRTILSQNARTLEDLVREMLRPMLRAWLDDNLPPLVERLVRTEIERVARGHR